MRIGEALTGDVDGGLRSKLKPVRRAWLGQILRVRKPDS